MQRHRRSAARVVRPLMIRRIAAGVVALVVTVLMRMPVLAGPQSNLNDPTSQNLPASSAASALTPNGNLVAGAEGTFTPVPPNTITPGGKDPGGVPSASVPPPYPAPNCPPAFGYLKPPTSPQFYTIFPYFTRSTDGGYDGHDPWYGYDVRDAIQPGGDPTLTNNGDPATAANMAGHSIAVELEIAPAGQWSTTALMWSQQRQGLLGPDSPGVCDNGTLNYGYGQTFLYGRAPASKPPPTALNAPPFGLGSTLLANVEGTWRIGTVGTLPGPDTTTRTYVHIPTCAWLDSSVPTEPTALHSVTSTTVTNGYTVFLVYNVTIAPGAVTWDWGDGTQTASVDAAEAAPATLPAYDAAAQTWSDPCSVSHSYSTVSDGRTITATQTFTIAITVFWNDGLATYSQPVPCNTATGGACVLTIGAGQGWQSGPHPVDQIEPIPFSPHLGG